MNKHEFEFYNIKAVLNKVLVQNQISLPGKMGSTKTEDPATEVPNIKKA